MISKKILIVEDDKMLSTIFRMFLKNLNHELIGVYLDGKTAIEKCKTENPDIVLMDIHIHGEIDGIQTAHIIQKNYDIPVIFLSSDTDETTVQSAIQTNSYGFLVKPVNKTTLGIAIELAFFKHKYENDLRNKESRYRAMIDASADAIIVVTDEEIEFINKAGIKFLSLDAADNLTGCNIDRIICADNKELFIEKLNYLIDNNINIDSFQAKLVCHNKSAKTVDFICSAIGFGGSRTAQLIIRDVNLNY